MLLPNLSSRENAISSKLAATLISDAKDAESCSNSIREGLGLANTVATFDSLQRDTVCSVEIIGSDVAPVQFAVRAVAAQIFNTTPFAPVSQLHNELMQ
jgi:hypothetical protein